MKFSKLLFLLTFVLFGMLATAQNVQMKALSEVGLTDAQITEVKTADKKFKQDAKAVRANTSLDRKAKGTQLRTLQQERKAKFMEIMGEEKYARFKEVAAQKRSEIKEGKVAAMAELDLTTDQENEIKTINQKFRKAGQELRADKNSSTEDKKIRSKELRKQHINEIKSVLTEEQYAKYIEIKKESRSKK